MLTLEYPMKHLFLKSLIVAMSLCSLPAMSEDHGPTKSKTPLVDLGAELKAKSGVKSSQTIPTLSTSTATPVIEHAPTTHNPEPVVLDTNQPSKKSKNKPIHAEPHNTHWAYTGDAGPKHWGDLSADNIQCKIGKNQSPINLQDKAGVGTNGLPPLDIRYQDVPLKIINNGHTVQVNYPLGSYIEIGGHRYELLQFHFHTPSEHQKNGFNYPMEVHLVHKDGEGNLAVLAIIFQEGEANPEIQTLLDNLPREIGKQEIHRGASINPMMFIPGNTDFYKYSGSLTTPPCTEGVYWMVFKNPIEASIEQIEQLKQVMGENARPVQNINARSLLKSWSVQSQEEQPLYEYY